MASDGRRRGSIIGDVRRSGQWSNLCRYDMGSLFWDRYGVLPGGRMIPCGGRKEKTTGETGHRTARGEGGAG